MNAIKTGFFSIVLSCCLTAVAHADGREAGRFFDQHFGNLRQELQTAREEKKQGVFIMFEQDECPWCEKMTTTVMNQSAVQSYYRKHFRTLTIDIKGGTPLTDFSGKEMAERDFAFQHRVRATPVFMFFNLDGQPMVKYTGATRDATEFIWLAQFVVEGDYKNKAFTAYKRDKLAGKH